MYYGPHMVLHAARTIHTHMQPLAADAQAVASRRHKASKCLWTACRTAAAIILHLACHNWVVPTPTCSHAAQCAPPAHQSCRDNAGRITFTHTATAAAHLWLQHTLASCICCIPCMHPLFATVLPPWTLSRRKHRQTIPVLARLWDLHSVLRQASLSPRSAASGV